MSTPPPIPHWTEGRAKGTARAGGRKAKRNGQTVEALALAAAEVYAAQGLAVTRHVGPPVRQVGRPARNGTFSAIYEGEGPPDLLVTLPLPNRPARHGWIEVKGRKGTSMPLGAVEDHQLQALRSTVEEGNPAAVLVCLRHPSDPTRSGWWLVPVSAWSRAGAGNRGSFTPERLDEVAARCLALGKWARGAPARPVDTPDWLSAIRVLDARDDCPWLPIWGGE